MKRLLSLAVLGFALSLVTGTTMAEAATGTLDPTAELSADRTMATFTGTLTCNPLVSPGFLSANVQEVVGRLPIQGGGGSFPVTCTGTSMPWSVTAQTNSAFVPGPASVTVGFFGFCFFPCMPPVIDSWGQQSVVRLLP